MTTSYDAASHPVSSSDGTKYSTDATGALVRIRKGTEDTRYRYDALGRMMRAQVGTGEIELAYDALDRTIARAQGEDETIFAYAGEAEDLAYERTGEDETFFAHGPGGPLAQKQGADIHYLLRDAHTDVVGLVGATGMEGTVSFSPWGEVRETTGADSRMGYQGNMTDPATGLAVQKPTRDPCTYGYYAQYRVPVYTVSGNPITQSHDRGQSIPYSAVVYPPGCPS